MGKLSEEDYAALRGVYERRALSALNALEVTDGFRGETPATRLPASAPSPAGIASGTAAASRTAIPRFCAGCGRAFASDERFCPACGRARAS
jgi:hypothetical protein